MAELTELTRRRRHGVYKDCKIKLADVYHTLKRLDKMHKPFASSSELANSISARLRIKEAQNAIDIAMEAMDGNEEDSE